MPNLTPNRGAELSAARARLLYDGVDRSVSITGTGSHTTRGFVPLSRRPRNAGICFHAQGLDADVADNGFLVWGVTGGHGPYIKNAIITHTRGGSDISLNASGKYLVIVRLGLFYFLTSTEEWTITKRRQVGIGLYSDALLQWFQTIVDWTWFVPLVAGHTPRISPLNNDYRTSVISCILDRSQLTDGLLKVKTWYTANTASGLNNGISVDEECTSISIYGPLRDKTAVLAT